MKNTFVLLFIFFYILFIPAAFAQNDNKTSYAENYKEYVAEVLEISDSNITNSNIGEKSQIVKIKVLDGDLKDKILTTNNILSGNPGYDVILNEKDKVLLNIENLENGQTEVYIANYYRMPALISIFLIFVFLLLILGGKKGFKSLVSLTITYLLIFLFLIPSILKGHNPVLITLISSIIITCISIFVITGFNYKGLSAIIGTLGGILIAGIIAAIAIHYAHLSGTPNEEAIGLWTLNKNLDFKSIFASALIIGALGVSMDVAMSIASCIFEIKETCKEINPMKLIQAGLNVGKDIMGANTNTLLLAYTGSALYLLLLVYNNVSSIKLLNLDSIVSEIVIALSGSIALLLCIPITALSAGFLQKYSKV